MNQIEVEWYIPNNPKNPNYIEKQELESKTPKEGKKEDRPEITGQDEPKLTQDDENIIKMMSEMEKIVGEAEEGDEEDDQATENIPDADQKVHQKENASQQVVNKEVTLLLICLFSPIQQSARVLRDVSNLKNPKAYLNEEAPTYQKQVTYTLIPPNNIFT